MRFLMALAVPLLFTTAAFAQTGEGEGEGEGATAPPGWKCDPTFFGDGQCDCGCGVKDSDCADATLVSCAFNDCGLQTPPLTGINNPVPSKADPTTCVANTCGDGVLVAEVGEGEGEGGTPSTEQCDDGNTTPGDGCDANCQVEAGFDCSAPLGLGSKCVAVVCGDGVVAGTEQCDDGNTTSGDGCSATCTIETGFVCHTAGQPCVKIPAGWNETTCSFDGTAATSFYGDGTCDCGCGAPDVDCAAGTTAAQCESQDGQHFDDCPTGNHVDPTDITKCVPGAPPGGEGEGEGAGGEGEGAGGEGEGAHGGEGEGSANPQPKPSCASAPVTATTVPASLALVLGLGVMMRRRRR
jgi:cysteine-rich repeat protein